MKREELEAKGSKKDLAEDAVYTSYTQNIYKPLEERIFFKPLSQKIAKALQNTIVSPTLFNFLGFFAVLAGGSILFASPAYKNILAAAVIYLAFLFDKIDGDLARAKGIASGRGQYIDGILDVFAEALLTLLVATAIGFDNIPLIGLSIAGPMFFYYHGIAKPFYLKTIAPTYRGQKSGWRFYLQDAISYNRCKHFLLLIVLLLIDAPSALFYLLPLLLPYTVILFLKNLVCPK